MLKCKLSNFKTANLIQKYSILIIIINIKKKKNLLKKLDNN